jgi:hypothetical protein
MLNRKYDREVLPPWFTRPEPIRSWQVSLFTDRLDDVMAALKVNTDELARWRERRWISVSPEPAERLEQPQVNEIRFVRDVARSGLNDAIVDALFADLPRPMNFDPGSVAYNFGFGWVAVATREEPDTQTFIEEHLDEWLELVAQDDVERLRALRERLDSLIGAADHRVRDARDTDGDGE